MVTAAESALAAVGVNVTLIEQVPFDAMVAGLMGQVFVCAKLLALVPVIAIPLMVAAPDPLLVMVTLCAPLVVLIDWFAKEMEGGTADRAVPVLRIWNDDAQVPDIPMS